MNKYQEKQFAKYFSPLLSISGLSNILKPLYQGLGHILMFHRVLPNSSKKRLHNHLSLEISPEQLISTIDYFVQRDYDILSLDLLHSKLKNNSFSKKFVCFTFDDGYIDNLEYAYPIFKEYNIPFTIYITTNFPDRKAILWWYLLEELILANNTINFVYKNKENHLVTRNYKQKEYAFSFIRDIFNKSEDKFIIDFFEKQDLNPYHYTESVSLSWEQIRKLNSDPLVTIGAHTVSHSALKKLNIEDAKNEIIESKMLLEKQLNTTIEHFSYPFGKPNEAGKRDFKLVKELGFKTATTTRQANIFKQHGNYMESLPRITINSITNKHVLKLQTSGLIPALMNKFKKIVID